MPTPILGMLPTCPGGALQPCTRGAPQLGLSCPRALGREGPGQAGSEHREDGLRPPVAEDHAVALLQWPGPAQQPGALGTPPALAWSDDSDAEGPGLSPRGTACSLPMWSVGQEARDRDSSVSSGRLSGSSGGHVSRAPPYWPWKEGPSRVPGSQRRPRKSDTRLERLRDRIRQQVRGQVNCASLGTSAPSSASRLCSASMRTAPRGTSAPSSASRLCSASMSAPQRTRKVTGTLPAPTHPGFGIHMTEPQGEGQALSRATQHRAAAPQDKTRRTRSRSCRRDKAPRLPLPSRAAKGKGTAWLSDGRICTWALLGDRSPEVGSSWGPRDMCLPGGQRCDTGLVLAGRAGRGCARLGMSPPHAEAHTLAMRVLSVQDPESVGVRAWRRGQELARLLLGPPPARPTLRSTGPTMGLGDSKATAAKGSLAHTRPHRPTAALSDPQESENTAFLASHGQQASIQSTMAVLQGLRQQTQAKLELAQGPEAGQKRRPLKLKPQNLGQRGPWSKQRKQGAFPQRPWVVTEQTRSSSDRARRSPPQHPVSTLGEWEPCHQQACAAGGWDTSFQKPPSPPEKLSPSSQRPWSALAGQAGPQRVWVDGEDREVPVPRPRHPLERPYPAPQHPWSGSFLQRVGSACKGRGAVTPPSKAKQAWPRSLPGKEPGTESCPPHLQPRGLLGRPHSSEALCDFMYQKTQARWQQALQQVVAATDALERRSQRLQEVYRKQREAMQGQAVPVVSQMSPGIVTFVPSSAQSGVLKAPRSPEPRELGRSTVTSGKVLGDQEVPGSFCLCLNRAWNRPEMPLPVSAASSHPARGLHVCLDPQLHTQHKQARLQALETMADVLQQRVDILTAKLHRTEVSDTVPTVPAYPGASVPSEDRVSLHDGFLDVEVLPWISGWEPWSPEISPESQRQGTMQEGCWQLEQRLQGDSVPVQAPGAGAGSTLGAPAAPHPTCGSLWLEDLLAARGEGLVTPWTPRSCAVTGPRRRAGESCRPAQWQPPQSSQSGLLPQVPSLGPSSPDGSCPVNLGRNWAWGPAGSALGWAQQLCVAGALPDASPTPEVGCWPSSCLCLSFLEGWRGCGLLWSKCQGCKAERGPEPHCHSLPTLWPTDSQEPRGLHPRGRGGHLADFQLKSLSFLESLKLDQRKQEQALGLLRQRAEQEVWETQMALDGLLFKHQLERLMEKQGARTRPGMDSKLEQPHAHVDPEPTSLAQSPMPRRTRSPPALGRDVTGSFQDPEEGQASAEGKLASAGLASLDTDPTQPPLAPLSPRDSPEHQGSSVRTGSAKPGAGLTAGLKQSLREEDELRAQHQEALLRLRQMAREEKACAGRAWIEHLHGCLGSRGHQATGAALLERTRQTLCRLEKEPVQREVRDLWNLHGSVLPGRQQLLQHHKAILTVQRTPPRPQSPSPKVKATWEGPSETGQPEGALCLPTPHRPGSSTSPQVQRGPESVEVASLASERWEGTPATSSDADGHQQSPRLAWGEDTAKASSPPKERGSHADQGDPQTQPRACWAEKRPPAQVGGCQGPSLRRLGADGPHCPQEASVAGLDAAGIPTEEPLEVESGLPGEQRTEACRQKDSSALLATSPGDASALSRAPRPAPAAVEEDARTPVHLGSRPTAGLPLESAGSLASSPTSSAGSVSGLSCSSLQDFQKATATLVQLSDSSLSVSGPEAERSQGTDPNWSEELSAHKDFGSSLFGGPYQGDPQPDAVPGGAGQVTWQRPERGQAGALPGSPDVAVAEDLVPERTFLQAGWPLPPQDVCSPRSGSELSEASSQIWDEGIEENLSEPGAGAGPTSGSSSPPGSSILEHSVVVPASGPRQGQEASGTSWSLSGGSDTGSTEQVSPEAASSNDLDPSLSFPSETSASEGAGGQERPQGAGLSLSSERSPPQASPGPEVPWGLASPVAKPQAPRVPEQACPLHTAGFLSSVDGELSYGSEDLPRAPPWATHLPPPPPTPQADSDRDEAQPCSEDFPSPPQEAMVPQDSLGPQQSGLSLGAPGPHGGPEGELGGSGPAVGMQAVGSQWSQQVTRPESPLGEGVGVSGGLPQVSAHSLPPSQVACMAGENVSRLLVACGPDVLGMGPWAEGTSGSHLGPQAGVQCFTRAGHQEGSSFLPTPPGDQAAWVSHGQAGSPGHTGEEGVDGLSHWAEDSLGRELLLGEHMATGPTSGSCSDVGTERDEVVALVSTQLTQRILCDSMAVLSGLAPGGSL
ncbi:LOW QUALITY PROTEIN: coiled-coil domain-containing protein 187 [Fukomys damarensis]|uniref:LOW QUALITY PROTEIN: coiled-coil domain-containing protein 187 n=1 Tax=Fukomys damarensis TaxID=885580 RepID=UPI001455A9C1|nr:LOW QUALITY PROTEIN: coiled-coil domain-containing protein 187 [Fukomys damarensis]